MRFKAGDKVKCIDNQSATEYLSIGGEYEVEHADYRTETPLLRLVGMEMSWYSDRFELIEKGEDMQENNTLGFKIGDKVKIIRKDDTFGWYDGMEDLLGTEQVITHVGYSGKGCSYLICGWYFPDGALELVQQPKQPSRVLGEKQFNPKPGDKIICNNGKEFTCCTLDFIREKLVSYINTHKPIIGYFEEEGWQDWNQDGTITSGSTDYFIREVIPQQQNEAPSKAEPMYSAEDIRKAFITDLGWLEYSFELIMESLEKMNNPEYVEYLRLKAMFESDENDE